MSNIDNRTRDKIKAEEAKACFRRIQFLQSKIDETMLEVGVKDEETYEFAKELCSTWIDQRNELIRKWELHEYDFVIPEN